VHKLPLLLLPLLAACGGSKPAEAPGHPDVVAKAVFEALKAGDIGPLEPHLMTAEEAKKIMGMDLDDSSERERWDRLLAQEHERLPIDWDTAKLASTRTKMDPMGGRATLTLEIKSEKGDVTVQVEVLKVGKRYVFQDLKAPKGAQKQAAPQQDNSGDDSGNGCDDGCGG
jgi:hypothetical protein